MELELPVQKAVLTFSGDKTLEVHLQSRVDYKVDSLDRVIWLDGNGIYAGNGHAVMNHLKNGEKVQRDIHVRHGRAEICAGNRVLVDLCFSFS